jgi:formyltetrahydrofolate deformylase
MYILRVQCKDKPGVVAAVAASLSDSHCNIEESAQFHDPHSGKFFMRVVFSPLENSAQDNFLYAFTHIAEAFEMQWDVTPMNDPVKTLILVSKDDHCLNDLLYRWRTNALNIDITAIASNHNGVARELADIRKIPFHHLPITPETKAEQEKQLSALIEETGSELVLLARYMQILSDEFCTQYEGRVINIHHSFLPGFKGARPYHQAHDRGVKIIGATAHFATADLDEGPIIAQDIMPVDHSHDPAKMQSLGRDTEAKTLAKAAKLYSERRIFLNGARTVIL